MVIDGIRSILELNRCFLMEDLKSRRRKAARLDGVVVSFFSLFCEKCLALYETFTFCQFGRDMLFILERTTASLSTRDTVA